MNNNLIVSGMVVLLICVGLSGCTREGYDPYTKPEDIEKIVGRWFSESINETLVIIYDGKNGWIYEGYIIINSVNYTMEIYYAKIHINGIDTNNSTYKYDFFDNDNMLKLTNVRSGVSTNYLKQ